VSPADSPHRGARLLAAASGGEATGERSLETLALVAGAVAFALAAVAALIAFGLSDAPIAGPGSVGAFASASAAVVALLAFAAGRWAVHDGGRRPWDIVDAVALAFAHAVIALLSWTLISDIMARSFIGASVFGIPVVLLSAAVAAVTAYLVFSSASHMDLPLLALILAVFLAEGVIASMLTASDPTWWKDNLSALGMTDDLSATTFNLTLIVAGVLVTTLARYATRALPADHAHGIRDLRICLIGVGVLLALVGVFPVDRFMVLHTTIASGMVVVFGVLVVCLHRWVRGLSRTFLVVGWIFLAVVALLAVLYAVGYYTLTAVELVAGILVFAWIILFIRNAAALQEDAA
jgi:hypothetical membrane protein